MPSMDRLYLGTANVRVGDRFVPNSEVKRSNQRLFDDLIRAQQ
jgi:hypothetical protein